MPEPESACPYGDESDIDARYLSGQLSPEETESFEQHYFGCDRCFAAVERRNAIRAALDPARAASDAEPESKILPMTRNRSRYTAWRSALAAAAVVIVALGIRQVAGLRSGSSLEPAPPVDAARGSASRFALSAHATGTVLVAAWPPPPAARSYRVRLLATDGSLLFERETADTSVIISRDVLRGADQRPAYWEVQALDALRSIVATSALVQVPSAPNPP